MARRRDGYRATEKDVSARAAGKRRTNVAVNRDAAAGGRGVEAGTRGHTRLGHKKCLGFGDGTKSLSAADPFTFSFI